MNQGITRGDGLWCWSLWRRFSILLSLPGVHSMSYFQPSNSLIKIPRIRPGGFRIGFNRGANLLWPMCNWEKVNLWQSDCHKAFMCRTDLPSISVCISEYLLYLQKSIWAGCWVGFKPPSLIFLWQLDCLFLRRSSQGGKVENLYYVFDHYRLSNKGLNSGSTYQSESRNMKMLWEVFTSIPSPSFQLWE